MKVLPVRLIPSRHAMAVVLSYFGYFEDVIDLMQVLSHSTRAYIVNANYLRGFLIGSKILFLIRKHFEVCSKWQLIDLENIRNQLKHYQYTEEQRLEMLKKECPFLYVVVYAMQDKENQIMQCIREFAKFNDNIGNYTLYVHGYFLPWLMIQRDQGNFREGKTP